MPNAPENPRILIVRLGAMGDVLHALPMAALLRQACRRRTSAGWWSGAGASCCALRGCYPLADCSGRGVRWWTWCTWWIRGLAETSCWRRRAAGNFAGP